MNIRVAMYRTRLNFPNLFLSSSSGRQTSMEALRMSPFSN